MTSTSGVTVSLASVFTDMNYTFYETGLLTELSSLSENKQRSLFTYFDLMYTCFDQGKELSIRYLGWFLFAARDFVWASAVSREDPHFCEPNVYLNRAKFLSSHESMVEYSVRDYLTNLKNAMYIEILNKAQAAGIDIKPDKFSFHVWGMAGRMFSILPVDFHYPNNSDMPILPLRIYEKHYTLTRTNLEK